MIDLLVIAPHPDDAEIGMGGSIVKMRAEGLRVGVLDLTNGEPTPHGDVATRELETQAATAVLGLDWRENLGLTNRELQATLAARGAVAQVLRRTRPRWLFAPYWIDAHPDHVAAAQLIDDARFWSKLTKSSLAGEPHHPERVFHYFSIHLRLPVVPSFIADISAEFPRKMESLRCYQSQFVTGREHDGVSVLDRVRGQAEYWGHMIGCRYGEPFSCREVPGLTGWRQMR
ncbi:MAG TPA: bacillithiol biosynthesis deacetylase BshB1 [Pirellulaceae bacterium]